MNNIVSYIGNIDILNEHKTAFLCSHKCPADIIIQSYDWATKMRDENKCVISSFHTRIEQDVFNFLKKGSQPIIKVPARGKYKHISQEEQQMVDEGRLLFLFFFPDNMIYQTKETCLKRNEYIAKIADEIHFAYTTPNGQLEKLKLSLLDSTNKVLCSNNLYNIGES